MQYTVGMKVFDNWEIVREIGQGAFGHVFEIQMTEAGVTACSALKVIHIPTSESDIRSAISDGMTRDTVKVFFKNYVDEIVREVSIMVSLKGHPNVVYYEEHKVIQTDDIGWDILIRMELLTSLIDYQYAGSILNQDMVLRLGTEIAEALVYCEESGLIHRDISPENIFVTKQEHFKLGDFGVARTLEKTTGGLSKKGKESYMAPEVYSGKPYGKTVDIYSLGLVLYRLLNKNRLPFLPLDTDIIRYEEREQALISRMVGKEIPLPVSATPEVGRVICKACAFRPEDRYQSAKEFQGALREVAEVVSGVERTTGEPFGYSASESTTGAWYEESAYSAAVTFGAGAGEQIRQEEGTIAAPPVYTEEDVEEGLEEAWIYPADLIDTHGKKMSVAQNAWLQSFEEEENYRKRRKHLMTFGIILGLLAAIACFFPWYLLLMARSVTVNDGIGSGKYRPGSTVTISAEKKDGYIFSGWEVEGELVELADSSAEKTTFSMPDADTTITAMYEQLYKLTVKGTKQLEGEYTAGKGVKIIAPTPKDGYTFKSWNAGEDQELLSDSKAETIVITMPDHDVIIIAEYEIDW